MMILEMDMRIRMMLVMPSMTTSVMTEIIVIVQKYTHIGDNTYDAALRQQYHTSIAVL